jgi:hypothetical protein
MRELALRREQLLTQARAQRRVAAEATAGIQRGLASVDRAASILRYLGRRPLVIAAAAAAAALVVAKPRQAVTWFGYAVTAYTMFRRARRVLFPQDAN